MRKNVHDPTSNGTPLDKECNDAIGSITGLANLVATGNDAGSTNHGVGATGF